MIIEEAMIQKSEIIDQKCTAIKLTAGGTQNLFLDHPERKKKNSLHT